MRFLVITPTIGRETLGRCLLTMRHQVWQDWLQLVVGDGPQEAWVERECRRCDRCRYVSSAQREGFYGTAPRNLALEMLDAGELGHFDYILFVDDDNVLLEPALYNAAAAAREGGSPPLIWQDILFTNKYKTEYYIAPRSGRVAEEGDWDSLNGIYRADIIRGLRWRAVYNHDLIFTREAAARAAGQWIKSKGVGGVHFLSWDTYELAQPTEGARAAASLSRPAAPPHQ